MNDLAAGHLLASAGGATEPPLFALQAAGHRSARRGLRGAAPVAVEDLDLAVRSGEIVGVLGVAGAGKSTLSRLAAGLLPLTAGTRYWRGEVLPARPDLRMRHGVQMIFQDPCAALNDRMRVIDIVGEAPRAHRMISPAQQVEYVALQLNRVGIDPMAMRRFPYAFSAGERVRIAIARALAVRPDVLVLDDPLGALDVSARAQLLNLLVDMRGALELTYLLASQDPQLLAHVCDRIVVMYRGRIVESAPTARLMAAPAHPHTIALLQATGSIRTRADVARSSLAALAPPEAGRGCAYRQRCPRAMPICDHAVPVPVPVAARHTAACHLYTETREAAPLVRPLDRSE